MAVPASTFTEWQTMRGIPLHQPKDLAKFELMVEHMTELRNSQMEEADFLRDKVSTHEVLIPILRDEGRESEMALPRIDSSIIQGRVYTPMPTVGPYPLIVYLRPGLVSGSLETEDALCRQLAGLGKCVVLNVGYRRAPEYPYPTSFIDVWEATKWAAENAQTMLNADPRNRGFLIGGSSTGAMLAALVTLRARETKLNPPLTGQILRSPLTIHPAAKKAQTKFDSPIGAPLPIYCADFLEQMFKEYGVPEDQVSSPFVSPLLAASLKGLPPAYVQLTEWSASYGEGKAYVERLREANVLVEVDTYEGQPHMFWMIPRIKGAVDSARDLLMGVKWLESEAGAAMWDTGIREDEIEKWVLDGKHSEGTDAWRRNKLCKRAGCGCHF